MNVSQFRRQAVRELLPEHDVFQLELPFEGLLDVWQLGDAVRLDPPLQAGFGLTAQFGSLVAGNILRGKTRQDRRPRLRTKRAAPGNSSTALVTIRADSTAAKYLCGPRNLQLPKLSASRWVLASSPSHTRYALNAGDVRRMNDRQLDSK